MSFNPSYWSGKMFRACSVPTEADVSREFLWKWTASGFMADGQVWTHSGLVLHSADGASSACSLATILEPTVPQKYFLSSIAVKGTLRRAEKRGKALPEHLKAALMAVAFPAQTEPVAAT